jgi:hypothetical protein
MTGDLDAAENGAAAADTNAVAARADHAAVDDCAVYGGVGNADTGLCHYGAAIDDVANEGCDWR